MRNFAKHLWTAPNTLVGLLIGLACLPWGAKFRRRDGVWEIYGPAVARVLQVGIPGLGGMPALTLGYSVLARDRRTMNRWRKHERIHVEQFGHWGPLMIPAYLLSSLYQRFAGGDPYYDNPFEREAYGRVAQPRGVSTLPRRLVATRNASPAALSTRQNGTLAGGSLKPAA